MSIYFHSQLTTPNIFIALYFGASSYRVCYRDIMYSTYQSSLDSWPCCGEGCALSAESVSLALPYYQSSMQISMLNVALRREHQTELLVIYNTVWHCRSLPE